MVWEASAARIGGPFWHGNVADVGFFRIPPRPAPPWSLPSNAHAAATGYGTGGLAGIGLLIRWSLALASTGSPMCDDETKQFHW